MVKSWTSSDTKVDPYLRLLSRLMPYAIKKVKQCVHRTSYLSFCVVRALLDEQKLQTGHSKLYISKS